MKPLRLRDVCLKIGSGATPRGGRDVYLDTGEVALIRSQNVYNDRFERNGLAFITQEHADQLRNVEIYDSDVLLNITGDSVARVCQVPPDVIPARVNQHVAIIRPESGHLDPKFLRFYLASPQMQAEMLSLAASGATRNALTKGMIESLEVPTVSIEVQHAIAGLLGALEDKIDLNRRINETLEAMARAIFKDWFVDFGPTRAKAEGHEPYLAPELWDLFPDAFDSEGNPIGWSLERIGTHVEVIKGLSYKGAGLTDKANGIPLHNLNSVLEGGGYKNEGLKFYSGDYKPRHIVQPGDLIVANTEQGFNHLLIGYSALIPKWVGRKGLISHHIFKVEPRVGSPLSRVWLHFALSASSFGEAVRRFSNGTTINMLPQDAFEIPEIVVPPEKLVQAFEGLIGPKLRRQEQAVDESRAIAMTRDLLLPKLMSGEIRLHAGE